MISEKSYKNKMRISKKRDSRKELNGNFEAEEYED